MATTTSMRFGAREILACAAILISVLAGKLQLPVGRLGLEPGPWSDIRLWGMLLGIVLFIPEIRSVAPRDLARPVLISLGLLLAYLFVRSLFDTTDLTPAKRLDLIYLILEALLIAVIALRIHHLTLLAHIILVFAFGYLLIAIGGQLFDALGKQDNVGLGWGPVGGPITFNRVQFLAFCVALCLAVGLPQRRLFFGVLGTIFLFAALASLQKAAILAAFIALAFAGAWFLLRWRLWHVAALGLIAMVATAAMLGIYGDRLNGRVERMATAPAVLQQRVVLAPVPVQTLGPRARAITLPDIPPDTGAALPGSLDGQTEFMIPDVPAPTPTFTIEALGALIRWCVYDHPASGATLPAISCPAVELSDRSSRLTFWAEAARGFANSPIFGNGIASYSATVPNPDTLRPDTYVYPHNLFFELADEGGAVAMILLGAALLLAIRACFLSSAPLQTRVYTMTFMVFLFMGAMFAGDFYDSRLFWLGAIILGFWDAGETQKDARQRTSIA